MATGARHRGHTYRGLPSPGETDSYLRASDVRAGRARVVAHERGGTFRDERWLVRLPRPVRWGGGRETSHVLVDFCEPVPGRCECLALPSTPLGCARCWEPLATSYAAEPEEALGECLGQLGWEVER